MRLLTLCKHKEINSLAECYLVAVHYDRLLIQFFTVSALFALLVGPGIVLVIDEFVKGLFHSHRSVIGSLPCNSDRVIKSL